MQETQSRSLQNQEKKEKEKTQLFHTKSTFNGNFRRQPNRNNSLPDLCKKSE